MGVMVARGILLLSLLCDWSVPSLAQKQQDGFYVFVQKPESWNEVYLYAWSEEEVPFREPFGAWPGGKDSFRPCCFHRIFFTVVNSAHTIVAGKCIA
ncbi:MAG: hypothetical protein ACOH5I_18300 [Oligoflexus sp.]